MYSKNFIIINIPSYKVYINDLIVSTLETFQTMLNRDVAAEECLLDLQTYYIDLASLNT